MSVDLAVWDGSRPSSDHEAVETFEELYKQYVEADLATAPTERILTYVRTLLERYPDLLEIDDDTENVSPWADSPVINNASGPFFYFSFITNDVAEEAVSYAIDTAREQGLVCFDPQSGGLAS